jgi:hypothetical protein
MTPTPIRPLTQEHQQIAHEAVALGTPLRFGIKRRNLLWMEFLALRVESWRPAGASLSPFIAHVVMAQGGKPDAA